MRLLLLRLLWCLVIMNYNSQLLAPANHLKVPSSASDLIRAKLGQTEEEFLMWLECYNSYFECRPQHLIDRGELYRIEHYVNYQ